MTQRHAADVCTRAHTPRTVVLYPACDRKGTLGGLVHILLVIVIVIVLLRVIQGRHPLHG